jgi:para-nitrobenzyl esterase
VSIILSPRRSRADCQRAIGESGGQFAITRTLAEAEAAGKTFAEAAGALSLSALRAMPADAVNRATGFQTSATVDGWVFPQNVATIFRAGKQNDVPVIIGSNANEGSIFTPATTTIESFRQQSQRRYVRGCRRVSDALSVHHR